MPRIRSVKPEFWTDEELADLRRDARLLYIGLWNFADEHGRLRGDPRYIKGQIFPYDDDLTPDAIDALLDELGAAGKVVRYRVAGRSYLYLPRLADHQRLEAEKVPSRLPGPEAAEPDPAPESARGADESARRADSSEPGRIGHGGDVEQAPEPPETGHEREENEAPEPEPTVDDENPPSPAATVRANKSARRADSSALLYGTGSMEHGAWKESARARERDGEPAPPAGVSRPDGLTSPTGLCALPDDFVLTDAMRRYAAGCFPQLDVDFETQQFISHYRSTGARRKSWPDQWQKWLRDSAKRASERAIRSAPGARPSTTDTRIAQAQALKALYEGPNAVPDRPVIRGEITR